MSGIDLEAFLAEAETAAEDPYIYTRADLEAVVPSKVRVGDLLAHAGPPGTRRFVGDPVTFQQYAGYRRSWQADVYRVEYASRYGPGYFVQPDSLPVWKVRDDRIRATP